MSPIRSYMLLVFLLCWLPSSRCVADQHPSMQSSNSSPNRPLENWISGEPARSQHRISMGEQSTTTTETIITSCATNVQPPPNDRPAESVYLYNSYWEFFDVFVYLGFFIPVIYLCQAKLRKAIMQAAAIVIPFLCATYICLRQWIAVKAMFHQLQVETISRLSLSSETISPNFFMSPWMLVAVLVALLAREWGPLHAITTTTSWIWTVLTSTYSAVHSPSKFISLVDSDLSTTKENTDTEQTRPRKFGIFDNQLTEEDVAKLMKLLVTEPTPKPEPVAKTRPRKQQPAPQPPPLQEGEDEFLIDDSTHHYVAANVEDRQADIEDTIYNSLPLYDVEAYMGVADDIVRKLEREGDDNLTTDFFCASQLPYDLDIIDAIAFPGTATPQVTMKDIYEEDPHASPEEMLNKLYKVVKENRRIARLPRPIPEQDADRLFDVNGLRRYMTENSAREKLWMKEGRRPLPENFRTMTIPELAAWLRDWREAVWITHMASRGITLERCDKCGLTVKKDDHQCFLGKSKQIRYEGGVPIQRTLQVVGKGTKVQTINKKQVHLETAIKNYDKSQNYMPSQRKKANPLINVVPPVPAILPTDPQPPVPRSFDNPLLEVKDEEMQIDNPTEEINIDELPIVTQSNATVNPNVQIIRPRSTNS